MAKISISCAVPHSDNKAAYFLKELLGLPLLTAKKKMEAGEAGIFFKAELFLNDHLERADEIRKILDFFQDINVELSIMMINGDIDWEDIKVRNDHKEETEYLRNLLDESEGKFQ